MLRLALVAVLLASESLFLQAGPSPTVLLSFATVSLFYMEIARASLCACMCAHVYTCIERYICGAREKGGGGGVQRRAWSQDTAHSSLSLVPLMLLR